MVFVVLLDVEIDGTVALVGVAVVQNLLYQLLLLDDVARGLRLDARRQHVECVHGRVITVGVVLRHLHRFELLQPCLLLYFVVAVVGIVLHVSHIGDVAHVAHLVAQVFQIAEKDVKRDGRAGMSQVRVAIHGGSAHIHAHIGGVQRLKSFLAPTERIVNQKGLFHVSCLFSFTSFLSHAKVSNSAIMAK